MIIFENQSDFEINKEILDFLEKIKTSLTSHQVELIIVHNKQIKALNKAYLHKNHATDVLSFPLDYDGIKLDSTSRLLGSIVISIDKALEVINNPALYAVKHSLKEELAILFTHALLHLLGFNHEKDNGEHRKKERLILKDFGIEIGLIDRVLEESKKI